MKLFDDLIAETERVLAPFAPTRRAASEITPWRDAGENELVLTKESAFELGAGGSGCGACLVTGDRSLVGDGGVDVYGGDLPDIRGDAPYARIAIVYAEGMDENISPLRQTCLDLERLYYVYEEPTYRDILELCLRPFAGQIFQSNGALHIRRAVSLYRTERPMSFYRVGTEYPVGRRPAYSG